MKLTDDSISQLVRVLQLAMLTGTDIVDNMRQMRFVENEDQMISPDPAYVEEFEAGLVRLEKLAETKKDVGFM